MVSIILLVGLLVLICCVVRYQLHAHRVVFVMNTQIGKPRDFFWLTSEK